VATSLRDALGRTGRGIRENWGHGRRDREIPRTERIYWCVEQVSVRDTFDAHAPQDEGRSSTDSVREWVGMHCDPLSDETVLWDHRGRSTTDWGWVPVTDERTKFIAGIHKLSDVTHTDLPWTHETRDWNGNMVPSPACTYLLTDDHTKLADVLVAALNDLDDDTLAAVLLDVAGGQVVQLLVALGVPARKPARAVAWLARESSGRVSEATLAEAVSAVERIVNGEVDTRAETENALASLLAVVDVDRDAIHAIRRRFDADLDDFDDALRDHGTTLEAVVEDAVASEDLHRVKLHNEWESGSMPVEWRPFWGEYVTLHGRHIYDIGHAPVKSEVHPGHSVVREHTTAATLGDDGTYTPANRAIVGMGLSGGFPGHTDAESRSGGIDDRWNREFGGRPDEVWGDTKHCWPTDLRDHPLEFKLFPPVERPSQDASLTVEVEFAEVITTSSWSEVASFLEHCQYASPSDRGKHLGFRRWDRGRLPKGFEPRAAPGAIRPTVTTRDGYAEVEIGLSGVGGDVPLGYHASVTCGWDERAADRDVYQFDVTFDDIEVRGIDDWRRDDWHLYYGVNGRWDAWYTANAVKKDETYDIGTSFRVYTVDDLPLLLRDCGIEWDGGDSGNTDLDRVQVGVNGPDHLGDLAATSGVSQLSGGSDAGRFRVEATETGGAHESAEHRWLLDVERREL
jgi:hypothetical protein